MKGNEIKIIKKPKILPGSTAIIHIFEVNIP